MTSLNQSFGGNNNVGAMLNKLSDLWASRAAVNKPPLIYSALAFDPGKADYSESLLPFKEHQAWLDAPAHIRSKCLSYAWIIYNMKTIYIECDIVTPVCEDLIKSPPSNSSNREIIQDVMAEALLDEALHTKMSLSACNYIYKLRGIDHFEFTDFNLVKWQRDILSSCTAAWERRLTRFGIACASETLITDYLKTMSEDTSIQPICHEVTRAHAMDEWSHSSVFSLVATDIVQGLSRNERDYLRAIITKTVCMFADNELGAWEKAFSVIGLQGYKELLHDTKSLDGINIYTGSVESLIDRIGLN
ncbi:diiron oxygenase [Pseudomonas syringae]